MATWPFSGLVTASCGRDMQLGDVRERGREEQTGDSSWHIGCLCEFGLFRVAG